MRSESEILKKIEQITTWYGRPIHYYTNTSELADSEISLMRWCMGENNIFSKNLRSWQTLSKEEQLMKHEQARQDELIRNDR